MVIVKLYIYGKLSSNFLPATFAKLRATGSYGR